jgi:hypothetical protein
MTLVHFPAPPTAPIYRLKVTLRKGTSTRLYEIRPIGDGWQTWVRRNGQPHRAEFCHYLTDIERIKGEFDREISDLLSDGWTVDRAAVLVWGT